MPKALRHEGIYLSFREVCGAEIDMAELTGRRAITVYGQNRSGPGPIRRRGAPSGRPLFCEVEESTFTILNPAIPSSASRHQSEPHGNRLQEFHLRGVTIFTALPGRPFPAALSRFTKRRIPSRGWGFWRRPLPVPPDWSTIPTSGEFALFQHAFPQHHSPVPAMCSRRAARRMVRRAHLAGVADTPDIQ